MFKWQSLFITIITGLLLISSSASARFYSVDPVGFQESNSISFNRYGYANNNPYGFTDPNGEYPGYTFPSDYFSSGLGSDVNGFAKGVGATALDVVTLDPSFTNGDLVIGKTVNPNEEFGYLVGRYASSLGLGKALSTGKLATSTQSRTMIGDVALEKTTTNMRSALERAGYKGTSITNPAGTETGTLHNIAHMKMDVRVMNGGPSHNPRVTTNIQGSKQAANPTTGESFKGNISKSEQAEKSHFSLDNDKETSF